jgi:hypothetical protein
VTDRIRWSTEWGGLTGHVGTAARSVRTALCQIWRPMPESGEWTLTVALAGDLGKEARGTLDELKAEAERRLSEYVSSLGAAFLNGVEP